MKITSKEVAAYIYRIEQELEVLKKQLDPISSIWAYWYLDPALEVLQKMRDEVNTQGL